MKKNPWIKCELEKDSVRRDRMRSPVYYRKKFGKTHNITVFDDNDHNGNPLFSFVCSFGADSDRSFSGCFFNRGLISIKQAMEEIDKREYNKR